MIKKEFCSSVFTFLFAFVLLLFWVTAAFSFVIYFRPLYYSQIDLLNIVEDSGYSKQEIIDGYDACLDFLTKSKDFDLGVFDYSPEGKAHFEDCRKLIKINNIVFVISVGLLTLLKIFDKLQYIKLKKIMGHTVGFWVGIFILFISFSVLMVALINFDFLFNLFHKIFFFGKTNWQFSEVTDPIIKILPSRFFLNMGILIACIIFLFALSSIIKSIIIKKRENGRKKL